MHTRTCVIDSNVLHSIEFTDLFVTFATRRLIQLRWSTAILHEVQRSLLHDARLSPDAIEHRLRSMQRALPDALAEFRDELTENLQVASSDRHVLALAVSVGADSIITLNIRDFPVVYCKSLGVEIFTPDEILTKTLVGDPLGTGWALRELAKRRHLPSATVAELLSKWESRLPSFVAAARAALG